MNDEDVDFFETQEAYDEFRNLQCFRCAGWAVDCACEENQFNKEDKEKFRKILE